MPNLERSLDLLGKAGLPKFLAEAASAAPLLLLAATEDVPRIKAFAPGVPVQSWEARNRVTEPPGTLAIDCRAPGSKPYADAPVSLFCDVLAAFLSGTKRLSRNPVKGQRYYLLSTPRSGSTFLSALLGSTQRLGQPTEHFKGWLAEYLPAAGLSFSALLDSLHAYSATPNGVFGTKIIINDLFALLGEFRSELMAELKRSPVFLLLRADKASQALSNVRSDSFSLYHMTEEDPSLRDLGNKSFEVDIGAVFQKERWLLRQEADLMWLLRSEGILPRIISYEATVQSRAFAACTLENFANLVRVDLDKGFGWPDLVRLSATLRPDMHLKYLRFRSGTTLYSARSEPWLQNVLGSGWGKVAQWGVASQQSASKAEIRIPPTLSARFFELLFHTGPNSPSELTVGGLSFKLPRPETGARMLRWIGTIPSTANGADAIELVYDKGVLGLEEVVFYAELPDSVAAQMKDGAALIPAS